MDKKTKSNLWYVFLAIWGVLILHNLWMGAVQTERIPYSQFQNYLDEGRVEEIRIRQNRILGEILDPALLRAGRFDRHVVVDRPDKTRRPRARSTARFAGSSTTRTPA